MNDKSQTNDKPVVGPFRRAVLRGLAVVLPPLLTIVLFLWAWNLIESYVLTPVENLGRYGLVMYFQQDARTELPAEAELLPAAEPNQPARFLHNGDDYTQIDKTSWLPTKVYKDVTANPGNSPASTVTGYYKRYVDLHYLRRTVVIPVFLCVFILVLYLVGKFMAAGAGRIFYNAGEAIIKRLPIIRNVYSSVKQVTDFVFTEQEIEFNRVVAVEYPRRGIWSVGFVTGESMFDIRSAANQPVLSVLMPTSPMPVTGFTVTVRKSETIDLDITMDQAIQFIVSCGVVVPPQQLRNQLHPELPRNDSGSNELESNPQNQQVMATSPTEDEITS